MTGIRREKKPPVAGDRSVNWLGQYPEKWRFQPLKYVCEVNRCALPEDTDPEQPLQYIDISSVDSVGRVIETTLLTFGEAPSRARRVLAAGDTFISTVRTYLTAIGYAEGPLDGHICSTGFAVLTPGLLVEPRFLFYWVHSSYFVGEIVSRSTGVSYPAVNASEVANLPFPVLTRDHQREIAAYLDRKTADLDSVIAAKVRMLDLLRQKRHTLVSRLVTRGLNSNAPTKDSGIAWLDQVPAHWSVERLKFSQSLLEQGWSPQCENRQADEGEWGVLKVGCVNGDEFDTTEQKALPDEVLPETRYEVRPGDILMSRGNTLELVGSAALVRDVRPRLLLCDLLYRLRVRPEKADPEYITLQLRSPFVRHQIERDATGTSPSMKKIGQETIRDFLVCLPPVNEQQAIVERVRRETAPIDAARTLIAEQLDKLREYRQALITAAVTGKLDLQRKAAV